MYHPHIPLVHGPIKLEEFVISIEYSYDDPIEKMGLVKVDCERRKNIERGLQGDMKN